MRTSWLRVVLAAVGVITLTAACTPEERHLWQLWFNEAPEEAADAASRMAVEQPQMLHAPDPTPVLDPVQFAAMVMHVQNLEAENNASPCTRFGRLIDAAGLPEHFHTVMRRESGCNPDAIGPNGEIGLLQVMPMWADDCGTTRNGLHDPATNIQCGVHIFEVQGPGAWTTW